MISFNSRISLIILFLGFLYSCKKDSITDISTNNSALIGSWINPSYNDSSVIVEKTANLKPNDYGITFKDNGTLIEHKLDGWCATPPVSFSDYNGTWILKDSIIQISVDFYGGKAEYKWKLVLVDNLKLKFIKRLEKYN